MPADQPGQFESHVWFLRTTELFEDQTESIIDWAGAEKRQFDFKKGQSLPFEKKGRRFIYVIFQGKVKLRTGGEGDKEKILDVAGPGDTIGPIDRILDRVAAGDDDDEMSALATEAVALSNGIAFAYELSEFQSLVERRPKVVLNVSRLLGLKQKQLEIRLSRLLFRSSLGKVAGLLSELAERYGEKSDEGIKLNFKLTHQEMASMIGVKRETVSECIGKLELDELISTNKRRITVLKAEELDQIV